MPIQNQITPQMKHVNLAALRQGKKYRVELKNSSGTVLSPEFSPSLSLAKAKKKDYDSTGIRASIFLITSDGNMVEAR